MTIFTSPAAVCRRSRRSPLWAGYQLPFARDIRPAGSHPVIGVWAGSPTREAEAALENGDADLIALARADTLRSALARGTLPGQPWRPGPCAVAVFALGAATA
ncbi:hypothetical protein LNP74_31855 [Klebsiella pneumoniae subsp. pneumoniae]|nr:hypothetical protein [Klebsiella pneumoniae subsp. pneumoniae]